MSNYIKFLPISGGAYDINPPCYILQIEQGTILLDCGSTDELSDITSYSIPATIKPDAILISHGDLLHIGNLLNISSSLQNCPIYTTLPVANMGKQAIQELHSHNHKEQNKDISSIISKINKLKYSESVILGGKLQGIIITPLPAGHTLGGTIWRIRKDTDDIIYAVNYNHRKERLLNGTIFDQIFTRPSVLITDSINALSLSSSRAKRDSELLNSVLSVLRRDGSVLMPVDCSLRVLELLHLMDQLWTHSQLNFPLLFLSGNSVSTIEYARSMLEWMGESAIKHFSETRETPFDFKCVRLCQSLSDVEKYGSGAKVVLCCGLSLESGFSREVLLDGEFYSNKKNMVLFTQDCGYGLSKEILDGKREFSLVVEKVVPLEGEELEQYQRREKQLKQEQELEYLLNERKRKLIEEDGLTAGDGNAIDIDEEDDQQLVFFGDKVDYNCKKKTAKKSTGALEFFANDVKSIVFPDNKTTKRLKVDEYGQEVLEKDFVDLKLEKAKKDYLLGDSLSKEDLTDTNINAQPQSFPTKCISFEKQIKIQCEIKQINFSGQSDGKSIKTILSNISPKKLVLIRGTLQTTQEIKQLNLEETEIYTPKINESILIHSSTNIYSCKLTDALVSSLNLIKFNDYELGCLNCRVVYEDTSDIPLLDLCSLQDRWKNHSLVIGDVKLTELKRCLSQSGIVSDFDRGALIVGSGREIRGK